MSNIPAGQNARSAHFPMPLTFAAALFQIGFWPTWSHLFARWNVDGGEYSHGLLLLGVTLYLLYQRREQVFRANGASRFWLLCASGCVVIWGLAESIQVLVVQQALLPACVIASLGACFGWRSVRSALAPVALLYLAVPIWNAFQPALQAVTVGVCDLALSWVGISAHIERTLITIPSGTFEVAQECSGLGFLLVSAALSAIYCIVFLERHTNQLLLLAVGLLLGLASNWIRVFGIVVIGEYSNMQNPLINDHGTLGWAVFTVMMAPWLWFANRLSHRETDTPTPDREKPDPGSAVSNKRATFGTPLVLLSLASIPSLLIFVLQQPVSETISEAVQSQAETFGRTVASKDRSWSPAFRGHDLELTVKVASAAKPTHLNVLWYGKQNQTKKLTYYANGLADDIHWFKSTDTVNRDSAIEHREAVLANRSGERLLVLYWYFAGSTPAATVLNLKLAQLRSLLGFRRDVSLVALSTPCAQNNCQDARELLAPILPQVADRLAIQFSSSTWPISEAIYRR